MEAISIRGEAIALRPGSSWHCGVAPPKRPGNGAGKSVFRFPFRTETGHLFEAWTDVVPILSFVTKVPVCMSIDRGQSHF